MGTTYNKKILDGLIESDGSNIHIISPGSFSNSVVFTSNVLLPSSTIYNGVHTINNLIVNGSNVSTNLTDLTNNKVNITNPIFSGSNGIKYGNSLIVNGSANIASSNMIPSLDSSKITTGEFPINRITLLSNVLSTKANIITPSIEITSINIGSNAIIVNTNNTDQSNMLQIFATPLSDPISSTFGKPFINWPLINNGNDISGNNYNATFLSSTLTFSNVDGFSGIFFKNSNVNSNQQLTNNTTNLKLNDGSNLVSNSNINIIVSMYVWIPTGYTGNIIRVGVPVTNMPRTFYVQVDNYDTIKRFGIYYKPNANSNEIITFSGDVPNNRWVYIVASTTNQLFIDGVERTYLDGGSIFFDSIATNNISFLHNGVYNLGGSNLTLYSIARGFAPLTVDLIKILNNNSISYSNLDDRFTITKQSPKFIGQSNINTTSIWPNPNEWWVTESEGSGANLFYLRAFNAFDYNNETYFESFGNDGGRRYNATNGKHRGGSDASEWIQIKYPSPQFLRSYSLSYNALGSPRVWTIQGSHDGVHFYTVSSYNKTNWNYDTRYIFYIVKPLIKYMYWRLDVTEINQYPTTQNHVSLSISEWMLYTTYDIRNIVVASAYMINHNTFKILFTDNTGELDPYTITNISSSPISLKLNIIVQNNNTTVLSGIYEIFYNNQFRKII